MKGKSSACSHRQNDLPHRVTANRGISLTPTRVRGFQSAIYRHYRIHGRTFPWREQFINSLPDFDSLAQAPLREVLRLWQGLGYNRRAMALKNIAQMVVTNFQGNLPSSPEALCAFAFNEPVVFIETNIRRAFIHHFFQKENDVKDIEILLLVKETLDTSNPRKWYFALMDYGVMLKKRYQNPNRKSAHYQKQPPFEGSNRQIRGMILRTLTAESPISQQEIAKRLGLDPERVKGNLIQLQREGFIRKRGSRFTIA